MNESEHLFKPDLKLCRNWFTRLSIPAFVTSRISFWQCNVSTENGPFIVYFHITGGDFPQSIAMLCLFTRGYVSQSISMKYHRQMVIDKKCNRIPINDEFPTETPYQKHGSETYSIYTPSMHHSCCLSPHMRKCHTHTYIYILYIYIYSYGLY